MTTEDSRGSRRPTMSDVARLAGVSLKTVSRVVNGEGSVTPETADRVHESITALGFRRNLTGLSLRQGRSRTIGLVVDNLGDPFYATMAAAIETTCTEHDYLLLAMTSERSPKRERELLDVLLD